MSTIGHLQTEEIRKRISESCKKLVRTSEHNRKISESNKGRIPTEAIAAARLVHKGSTLPENTTAKMSVSHSKVSPEGYQGTYKERGRAKHHRRLVKKFGLTIEEYEAILVRQHYQCAICGKHVSEQTKAFAVDHDHVNSSIRGILCNNCNAGIGFFQNDPEICAKAKQYLEVRHVVC